LIGYLNLLLKDENTRIIHTTLKKCYSSALKMRSLINDFLYFTGPRPGQLPFEISEFSFNNLVTETIENFHLTYPHLNIQLQGETTANIKGDRGRIEQVIANLLNNAIKYAPGKNQIDVVLKQETDNVVLQVRDYGIGIEPGEISLLFDKFYRAGNTGKIKGMGLGLYIVKEIVNFHKGRVLVESTPGKGTIFTVELPIGAF
jgi:signal transduction histidine kinase